MRSWLILILFIVLPASLPAAAPQAKISGPRLVKAGDRILLDASHSTGETYKWDITCVPPLAEDQDPPEVSADGLTVGLQSYLNHEYHATLIVSGIDDDGKPQSDLTRWTVFVIANPVRPPPPAPNPSPQPNPVPPAPEPDEPDVPVPTPPTPPTPPKPPVPPDPPAPPDIPEGELRLSRDVRDWALEVASPDRQAEAAALAAAVSQAGSTATTPQQIINELGAGINQAIAAHPAAWQPFREKYRERVQQLVQSGQLNTLERWHLLRSETAVGLQAAAAR